jgi:NSS family neurotransmitter:Na+ symporter
MKGGTIIGAVFFLLVLFAALTSSISLMETVVSIITDKTKLKRKAACLVVFVGSLLLGMCSSLGFGIWSKVSVLGMTILDMSDFLSNSVLMPIVAFLTCILIGWCSKPDGVLEEINIGLDGKPFRQKKSYLVTIRFVAPVLLMIILLQAFNVFSFLG